MHTHKDLLQLVQSLVGTAPNNKVSFATIYSVHYKDRHPSNPTYSNQDTIIKLIGDGVLKLISEKQDGQPSPNNAFIHYFTNYEVSYVPQELKIYLESWNKQPSTTHIQGSNQNHKYNISGIELDTLQGIIKYGNTKLDISKENNIIKLFICLFDSQQVVDYVTIAKHLQLNCFIDDDSKNIDVSREVQYLKRDLLKYLKKELGYPAKLASNLIITSRKVGYKLRR